MYLKATRYKINKMEVVTSQDLIEEGLTYCREFLGGSWAKVSKNNFIMIQITGGLSNVLYKCSLKDSYPVSKKEPRHVLLRLYGEIIFENTDTVLNDSVTFTLLAERNLGPKLYGIFNRGRLEEYVNSRVLESNELPKPHISKACARIMCRFHLLNMPMNKTPRWLFDLIQKYLNEVSTLIQEKKYKCPIDLQQEYQDLKVILASIKSPVVFCHNDLQGGNILYMGEHLEGTDITNYHFDHTNDILRPIDFEYSSYNYRGFDMGNHFCEWCYNYHHETFPYFTANLDLYPDKQQQLLFVREYIREKKLLNEKCAKGDGGGESCEVEGATDDDEDAILLEANGFALASHFLWFLWSIIQSKKSTIKFGYKEYAEERLKAYFTQKPDLLQMLQMFNQKKSPN